MSDVGPAVVLLTTAFVFFRLGREWERVFGVGRDDCPYPGECLACASPQTSANITRVHYTLRGPYATRL